MFDILGNTFHNFLAYGKMTLSHLSVEYKATASMMGFYDGKL